MISAVSDLPVEGFSWKFVSWTNKYLEYPKFRFLRFVYEYINVSQFWEIIV